MSTHEPDDVTPSEAFGRLLGSARMSAKVGVREAARAANISEGLWRQLEKGCKSVGSGLTVPTNPRPATVRAAAAAVDLEVDVALEVAGYQSEAAEERAEQERVRIAALATKNPFGARSRPVATNAVIAAIEADDTLLPEAKAHFLNQYQLLRRIPADQEMPRAARKGSTAKGRGEDEQGL